MSSTPPMPASVTPTSEAPAESSQMLEHKEIDPAPIHKATFNRQVLEWRDNCIAEAPQFLRNRYHEFLNETRELVSEEGLVKLTFSKRKLIQTTYQERFNQWVEASAKAFYADAERELERSLEEGLEYLHVDQEVSAEGLKASYGELGMVIAAAGATAAGIPLLAAGSVVSAGGILGFFGATTIAWPVVAVGGGVLATVALFGGFQASQLQDKYVQQFMDDLDGELRKRLFTAPDDSLLDRLQGGIEQAAAKILQEAVQ